MKKSVTVYCSNNSFEESMLMKEDGMNTIFIYPEPPKVPYWPIRMQIFKFDPTYAHERPRPSFWFRFCKAWKEARKTFRSTMRIGE